MKPKSSYVVVVGASLGGVTALSALANALPNDFPAPVIAVLQACGNSRSLPDLISPFTALGVSYATEGEELVAGHIYLAPPDAHVILRAPGVLGLDDGAKVRHVRPAADRLFRSAAEIQGSRVIGIVLTGEDHDGTDGLKAIKAAGGIAIVQDPQEARDPNMPINALIGDSPDHCLPLEEMAELLITLLEHPRQARVA